MEDKYYMYKSLATKYRPQTFAEVCAQQTVVEILQQIVASGKPKNAYIFAGESGCGKTTLARILARALNNGVGEPIEIDAASNRGVDNIRNIIETAGQRSLTGTYKIYIFDEAHMFTQEAENALLKLIEEPPTYTIFIFCTTDPNKLPVTLLNRMQRFNISKIPVDIIAKRLEYICQQEGFTNYSATCDLISKICNGCMRDAITLLDQCADLSTDLNLENTKKVLGDISYETMLVLTHFLKQKMEGGIFSVIEQLYSKGADLKQFISNYLDFVLDVCKYIIFNHNTSVTALPEYLVDNTANPEVSLNRLICDSDLQWLVMLSDKLLEIKQAIKYDISYKSTIEAYLLRICRG